MRVAFPSLLGAALVASGCNVYFAPPIRAVQYGAPARLEEGRIEVGGTAGGIVLPDVGGPHLGIGIRDWVALEAGGNLALDYGRQSWAMAYVGPRFSYAPHRERRVHLISDLELGLGVGVGGVHDSNDAPSKDCASCDGLTGFDRLASGGYAGVGVGAQIAWLSLYARTRIEVSQATNVPTTVWPSASVGIEFNLRKRAAISVGGGYVGYRNAMDRIDAWFYQVGISLFFDAFGPRRHAPAITAPPTPMRPLPAPPVPAPPLFVPAPPTFVPAPPPMLHDDEPDDPGPAAGDADADDDDDDPRDD